MPPVSIPANPPSYAPARWLAEQLDVLPHGRALVLYPGRAQLLVELARRGWTVAYADRYASGVWWARSHCAPMPAPRTVRRWLSLRQDPEIVRRFEPWADQFFDREATVWLGIWYHHLMFGEASEAERSAGIAAVYRAMAYWLRWPREAAARRPNAAEVFRRGLRPGVLAPGALRPAQTSPEAAARALEGELLFCYVPPQEGIEGLGLAPLLWERWTGGDPLGAPTSVVGRLGGPFERADQRQEVLGELLREAEGFAYVALAPRGGERVSAPWRTPLFRRELEVPYPAGDASSIIAEGLVVVGQSLKAGPAGSMG